MNVNKLKGKIAEKGLSVEKLAQQIGVDRSSLQRKLNNAEIITIGEAMRLKVVLAGGDPCDLSLNYGRAWIALGNIMPHLERYFVIKKRTLMSAFFVCLF